MVSRYGTVLISAILFAFIILFVSFGLSPVVNKTTAIMAIVPSIEDNYSVVFQVCAEETIMRAPEVKISSDIEEKNIRLGKEITPNTCRQTAAVIKTSNPDTIVMKKIDKSELNKKVSEAENKVLKIRSELLDKNAEIAKLVERTSENDSLKTTINTKVNELTIEIVKLRKELEEAKRDYEKELALLKGNNPLP